MAVDGHIDYLEVPFASVKWNADIKSPFPIPAESNPAECLELKAEAWKLDVDWNSSRGLITFDVKDESDFDNLLLVPVGFVKEPHVREEQEYKFHFLIVKSISPGECERVGIAEMPITNNNLRGRRKYDIRIR